MVMDFRYQKLVSLNTVWRDCEILYRGVYADDEMVGL